MDKKEITKLHRVFTNQIRNTLMIQGEQIKSSDNPYVDFIWKDMPCRVAVHKTIGHAVQSAVMEYTTDTKSNNRLGVPVTIFIDYENPENFYVIKTARLYQLVDDGLNNKYLGYYIVHTKDVLENRGLCVAVRYSDLVLMSKKYNIMKRSNDLVKQYEPLVNKMTKQFTSKLPVNWEEVKSMAYEGLALAINDYDEAKSKMTFTQFAAFAIRNAILTGLDNELRTVKLSNYAQKKAIEHGETTFNSVSIDRCVREEDEDKTPREMVMGMYENEKFSNGDVFEYLYTRLESQFNERECKIFYMSFGLNGMNEEKGKDIAKMLGISEGLVSQKVKKVVKFIRQDNDLCEMLGSL